jgi:hypothetical protein
MAYTPISGIVPQLSRNAGGAAAGGYYLKGYSAGTTTPLSMGTDSTPTATLAKCKLNSRGEPISNDADETTVFIPHYNASYKLVLYVTEADADANTTANAVWVVDNISGVFDASQVNYTASVTVAQRLDNLDVDDYTALRALTSAQLTDGDSITVTDDGIAGDFVVKTGTVTDNGGTLIVFTDDSNRYAERRVKLPVNIEWFEVTTAASDQTTNFVKALNYANGKPALIPDGSTYRVDTLGNTALTVPIYLVGKGTLDGNNTSTSYFNIGGSISHFWVNGPRVKNVYAGVQVGSDDYKIDDICIQNHRLFDSDNGWEFDCRFDEAKASKCTFKNLSGAVRVVGFQFGNNDAFLGGGEVQENIQVDHCFFDTLDKTTASGECHAVLAYGKRIVLTGNIVKNISNSNNGTGAEGLYTKGIDVTITGNVLEDANTGQGAIMLKGNSIGAQRVVCANNDLYSSTGEYTGIRIESDYSSVTDNNIYGFGETAITSSSETLQGVVVKNNNIYQHRGRYAILLQHAGRVMVCDGNVIDGCSNAQTSAAGAEVISISNVAVAANIDQISVCNNVIQVPTNTSTTTLAAVRVRIATSQTTRLLKFKDNQVDFTGASTPSNRYDIWLDADGSLTKLELEGAVGENTNQTLRIDGAANISKCEIDWPGYINRQSLSGNLTLTSSDSRNQSLDPNGASRNVLMPPEANIAGEKFYFSNRAGAAEDLVIKDDSDTSTIVTISQNEGAVVWSDGTGLQGFVGAAT